MANGVFNICKGRARELYNRVKSNDPAGSQLVLILCTGTETEENIKECETVTALLATVLAECTFTNYVRTDLDDGDLAALPSPDHTADDAAFTLPDTTITSAGGASNDTISRLIVCYDISGTDADGTLQPMTFHDFAITTNGGDLTMDFPTTELFLAGE
ncbi:unnamed protein product [marine sediment metagenome]|uniref:Uncharacterized protein n=1 Tax=marine sediment metagenome TaxID=412755 RepID=X0TA71_9ZZZZ